MIISRRAVGISVCLISTSVSCDRSGNPNQAGISALATSRSSRLAVATLNPGWNEAAGPILILATGEDITKAVVVFPYLTDSALANATVFALDSISNRSIDLFSRHGPSGRITLLASPQKPNAEGCPSWPEARLSGVPAKPWKAGLLSGRATAIPIDSIEGMSAADSVLITAQIVRVSAAFPSNADPVFRGLPFSVHNAYRFMVGSTPVLAGTVVRRIASEANPREERTFFLAERSKDNGPYRAVFHNRGAGTEDIVQSSEILAVVRFVRSGRSGMFVTLEYEDGGYVGLLERIGDQSWKLVWRSAYTGC